MAVNDRSTSGVGRFGYVPVAVMTLATPGPTFVAFAPPSKGCAVLNSERPSVVVTEEKPRLNTLAATCSRMNSADREWALGACLMTPYLSSSISSQDAREPSP